MDTAKKWFIGVLTVLNFFTLLYFGYSDKTVAMGLALVSFITLVIHFTSKGIQEIAGPKFKIKSKLKEVDNKIEELNELAKVFSKGVLDSIITLGRIGGGDTIEQESFRNEVIDLLKSLKISKKEISEIQSTWLKLRRLDHANMILRKLMELNISIPNEIKSKFKVNSREGKDGLNELKEYLTKETKYKQMEKESINELIQLFKDYKFYSNKKSLRRPEIWKE